MKIGVMLPAWPLDAAARARDPAQELGLDALGSGDHFLGRWHPQLWKEMPQSKRRPDADAYADQFCMCSALGPTTRIPLGIAVTDAIRRAATDLARTALTLQHVYKAGFNLGLPAGEAGNIVPFGYRFKTPVAALEAALPVLRRLLDTGGCQTAARVVLAYHWNRPRGVRVSGWRARGRGALRLVGQYAAGACRPEP